MPIDRLNTEKTRNSDKLTALGDLGTRLTALQTTAQDLNGTSLFTGRLAASTSTGSTWPVGVAAGTALGSYAIAVTQLATASQLKGTTGIAKPINSTNNVSGLTVSNIATATPVTAGTFTVNGKQVSILLTDSLQQVFDKISAATSSAVTGSYDSTTDKVTLSSASPVTLGAANDSSNYLTVMKLANNGTGTVASSSTLGTVKTTSPLASGNLRTAITAVDGSGNGSFTVNSVTISYNVNTDSLSTVIGRINSSTAGVAAAYDSINDRMMLTNNTTGDTGISVSEASGGLLGALGLTTGSTLTRGQNAQFTVNGGATLTTPSNTLTAATHGITGLSVTVNSLGTQTIQVSGDTTSMRNKVQAFIDKFNDLQTYLDAKTAVTSVKGKVTTSILSDNREVQSWGRSLRSLAFQTVSGLSGTIQRLENLGIDFTTGTNQLSIKDGAKLDAALRDKATDVAAFFQTATTGFVAKLNSFFTSALGATGTGGLLRTQQDTLTNSSAGIDRQISDLQRRLDQQRAVLEASFIRMESAQSLMQSQSTALTNAFK